MNSSELLWLTVGMFARSVGLMAILTTRDILVFNPVLLQLNLYAILNPALLYLLRIELAPLSSVCAGKTETPYY